MIKEGKVTIEKGDAFYNPQATFSRDISVLFLKIVKPSYILDGMCATGIRGIRYAVESGIEEVIFNDINPLSIEITKKNIDINGVKNYRIENKDISILLHEERFQAIDLDPFGSPSPYLQAVSRSITHGGYLLITATDTAPLTGSSPVAARKKYHVILKKTPWLKEVAIRVLLGYIQHHLAIFEKALIPMVSFHHLHHVRVMGRVVRKPSHVSSSMKHLQMVEGMGPIWTGNLHDKDIVRKMKEAWEPYMTKTSLRLLSLIEEELEVLGYFNIHYLARELSISPPPIKEVISALEEMGFRASRTHADPLAIKTDAGIDTIKEVLLRLSSDMKRRDTH